MTTVEIAKGVSKFLKIMPDLVNDYPQITKYLSRTLFTLKELKALKYSDMVFIEESKKTGEDEDEMVFVETYYHLMAELLHEEYLKVGNWADVVKMYESNGLDKVFANMKSMILEDSLFSEIADKYDPESAKVICSLLQQEAK